MEIINTKPGDKKFHLFESVVENLYAEDSIRHKQRESINKEFLENYFVVLKDGIPQARAVFYNNPHLYYNGIKALCIGNYESADDKELSALFLNFITDEAKKKGAEFLIGPMNGSTWDDYRFSVHHNHTDFLLEPYHHLYYNEQFIDNGFKMIATYTSAIDNVIICDQPYVLQKEKEFKDAGVQFRNINMNEYEEELKKLYPFISSIFNTNFLYTPIAWEIFRDKYMEAAPIINPEYVLIAEDGQKNIIGFIFCYDDLLNTDQKSLVVKTVARDLSQQWQGLGHVMGNKVMRLIKNKGYDSAVHAFMITNAKSTNMSVNFLGDIYKNYVLYGKVI